MTFEQQVTLMWIAAAIALASSLLTGVVAAIVNHRLSRKQKLTEVKDGYQQLMGKMLGASYGVEDDERIRKIEEGVKRLATEMAEIPDDDAIVLNIMTGVVEEQLREFRELLRHLKQREHDLAQREDDLERQKYELEAQLGERKGRLRELKQQRQDLEQRKRELEHQKQELEQKNQDLKQQNQNPEPEVQDEGDQFQNM